MLDEGYGMMPNKVLFDKSLSPNAKLLFVYISSLCAKEGYCWANNQHLGEKLGISKSQVSRHIRSLEKYIDISDPYNERRTIRLRKNAQVPTQKPQGSLRKNAQHNNTREYYKYNKGESPEEAIARMYTFRPTELTQ